MARASLCEKPPKPYSSIANTEYPRIGIELPRVTALRAAAAAAAASYSDDSSDGSSCSGLKPQDFMVFRKGSTPFSSKRVARESDTPHTTKSSSTTETTTTTTSTTTSTNPTTKPSDNTGGGDDDDKDVQVKTEDSLLPGDKTEMNRFAEQAMKSSKIQIKITVPLISLQIK